MSPPRSPDVIAPPARLSRRRMGSIWRGSITPEGLELARARSAEIPLEDPAVCGGQRCEVGHRGALVDLMHALTHQTEFEHRAVILDEARVGGAAAGGELGLPSGHVLDGRADEVEERARLDHERLGVRRLPFDVPADAPGGCVGGAFFKQHFEGSLAVTIIEADVEPGTRLTGDEIDDRIA